MNAACLQWALGTVKLFSPTWTEGATSVVPPSWGFDVTVVRLRTWTEKCRSSATAPLPPPSSSSYLPASLDDRPPTARRPAATLRGVASPSHLRRWIFLPVGTSTGRLASLLASILEGINQVFASFLLQLPFTTYGENGQTCSYKPNFLATDSWRTEIPAGKPPEAAFPPRWRYGLKQTLTGLGFCLVGGACHYHSVDIHGFSAESQWGTEVN